MQVEPHTIGQIGNQCKFGILFNSWRDNSSSRCYTLGPLSLWQCFMWGLPYWDQRGLKTPPERLRPLKKFKSTLKPLSTINSTISKFTSPSSFEFWLPLTHLKRFCPRIRTNSGKSLLSETLTSPRGRSLRFVTLPLLKAWQTTHILYQGLNAKRLNKIIQQSQEQEQQQLCLFLVSTLQVRQKHVLRQFVFKQKCVSALDL